MAKLCKIKSENKALNTIVFEYDGKDVQLTGTYQKYDDSVYIKVVNGRYESIEKPKEKTVKKEIKRSIETTK